MKRSLKIRATIAVTFALMVFVAFSCVISFAFYKQAVRMSGMSKVDSAQTQFFVIFICAELIFAILISVLMSYLIDITIAKPLANLNDVVSDMAYLDSFSKDKEGYEELNEQLNKLDIHTEDEIEELYHSIQKLQSDINDYVVGVHERDWEAEHDSMTMLYNKVKFENRMKEFYPFKDKIFIACLDIINMSVVNTKLSTQAGDSIIGKVARELRRIYCETIHTYRIEEDKFVVVMLGYDEKEAINMLTSWNDRVGRLNRITDNFDCRVVWGGAYGGHDFDVNDIYKRAEAEMYCQKMIVKDEFGGI